MNENLSDDREPVEDSPEDVKSKDETSNDDDEPNLTDDVDTSGPKNAKDKPDAKKTPLFVILAGIVLTVLVIICLQVDDWGRDWTTNFAETDPAAKDVNLRPVESELSVADLSQIVVETMSDAVRWQVINKNEANQDLIELELVHKTFLMGFADDVKVEIVANQTGSTMYVKSQSRVGKGDLGQNPRNIKELVSLVRARLTEKQ